MSSSTVPLLDDTLPFGEERLDPDKITHPYVAFFHLFFRCAALIAYILCEQLSSSFIIGFVIVTLLLSMDFWTVKNITGRLMVGLRWWNYIDDDGVSHWVYESRRTTTDKESTIFWMGLTIPTIIWSILFLTALFGLKFRWMVVVVIALSLNISNLYGYIRCKLDLKSDGISSTLKSYFQGQILRNSFAFLRQTTTTPSTSSQVI